MKIPRKLKQIYILGDTQIFFFFPLFSNQFLAIKKIVDLQNTSNQTIALITDISLAKLYTYRKNINNEVKSKVIPKSRSKQSWLRKNIKHTK